MNTNHHNQPELALKHIVPLLIAVLLTMSLFLPWVKIIVSVSGYDLLRAGQEYGVEKAWMLSFPSLIGLASIIIILKRCDPILYGIPSILTIIVMIAKGVFIAHDLGVRITDLSDLFKASRSVLSIGVWTTLLSLIFLGITGTVLRKNIWLDQSISRNSENIGKSMHDNAFMRWLNQVPGSTELSDEQIKEKESCDVKCYITAVCSGMIACVIFAIINHEFAPFAMLLAASLGYAYSKLLFYYKHTCKTK